MQLSSRKLLPLLLCANLQKSHRDLHSRGLSRQKRGRIVITYRKQRVEKQYTEIVYTAKEVVCIFSQKNVPARFPII